MKEFIVEHLLEIFFMVLSTVLIGFLRSEHKKNKELKQYREEDQNKKYREMVLSEIKPIIQEIHTIQTDLDTKIKALETHHDGDKDAFDIKIKDLEMQLMDCKARYNALKDAVIEHYKREAWK